MDNPGYGGHVEGQTNADRRQFESNHGARALVLSKAERALARGIPLRKENWPLSTICEILSSVD